MELHDYKKTIIPEDGSNTRLGQRLWESDISATKRTIKEKLINNIDIRTLLDNPDLADCEDYAEYLGTNIFPYLVIPSTITDSMNYICFKVDDTDTNYFNSEKRDNPLMKVNTIQFMVLVHKKNAKTIYGLERHDAIAFVVRQIFGWAENIFPFKVRCISDVEGITDNSFLTRTLTFEAQYTNNLYEGRRINPYNN